MERLVTTDIAWGALNRDDVGLFPMAGARASLAQGLRELMAANEDGLARATSEVLSTEKPSWRDTHPPTASRIAGFRAAGTGTGTGTAPAAPQGPTADRPATDLLEPGWLDTAEGALLVRQLPLTTGPSTSPAGLVDVEWRRPTADAARSLHSV